MLRLAVCNHKGGTGKTTSTINIAAVLRLLGKRVLVIDLDPQGFLTRMVGLDEPPVQESSIMLFNPEGSIADVSITSLPAFDIIPSSTSLSKFMRKLNKPTDALWAKESIDQAGELPYDAIVFDTAAAITVYSLNALVASEHVIIPITPEYQPVVGGEQTFQTALMVQDKLNPDLRTPHILLTQVDGRKRNHQIFRPYLRQRYGNAVMESIIRTSASLAVTYSDGTTVFYHAPHTRGARDYANATDELLRRIAEPKQRSAPLTLSGVDASAYLAALSRVTETT